MVGTEITVEGFGELKGETEKVKVQKFDGTARVVLTFRMDGKNLNLPFRLADGIQVGSTPEGGFRIPAKVLSEMKESVGTPTNNGNNGSGNKPDATTPSTSKRPVKTKAQGNGMSKTATIEKETTAVKTGKTPAATNGKTPPAATTRTRKPAAAKPAAAPVEEEEEEEAPPAAAPANRRGRKPATPPAAPPAEPVKTRGRKPAAAPVEEEEEEEAREPSPMELADRRRDAVPEGCVEISLTPLMYRQIAWNEFRPFPEGRRVPGFSALKKAFDAAAERSYVYVTVNEAAAKFLVQKVFVAGFGGNWVGGLAGGFRRVARRISDELAEAFDFEVPATIANYTPARKKAEEVEEEPEPVKTRGRKPAAAPPAAVPASRPVANGKPAAAGKNGKTPVTATPAVPKRKPLTVKK
jgi:hypothetical protein